MRKLKIYIGKNSFPETVIRHRFETAHDFIVRATTVYFMTMSELCGSNLPWKEVRDVTFEGHLMKPVMKLCMQVNKHMIERLDKPSEPQPDAAGEAAEALVYYILSSGDPKV